MTGHDLSPPRFEVTFVLEATAEGAGKLRAQWAELGEEVEVAGEEVGLWSCHIHTDDPGAAVEAGIDVGRPRRVRVVDLAQSPVGQEVASGGFSPLGEALTSPVGVVAAVEGPGLVERFRRLGAQGVVDQPGAGLDQVLEAVEAAPAPTVIVLPNSPLLVPLAEKVDALTVKRVEVVPTRAIPQGLAAMAGYLPGVADVSSLVDDMAAAAATVFFGEVTRARRRARVGGWEVAPGDWLGWGDGRVVVADPDRFAALRGLVATLLPDREGRIAIYAGADALPSEVKALEAWVGETHPSVGFEAHGGGQRTNAYLVAVE